MNENFYKMAEVANKEIGYWTRTYFNKLGEGNYNLFKRRELVVEVVGFIHFNLKLKLL